MGEDMLCPVVARFLARFAALVGSTGTSDKPLADLRDQRCRG
jgi:hypothetical protein